MKIRTLQGLGFGEIGNGDFNRVLNYLRDYVCNVKLTYEYDEELKESYLVWYVEKEDFSKTFGELDSPIMTTIIAYNYMGRYYLRWSDFFLSFKNAA